jgi:cobalt/nickel transport protein
VSASRVRLSIFLLGGLLVSLLLAGVVSNFASGRPDGLDAASLKGCTLNADDEITGGNCAAKEAGDHELAGSPLADYALKGVGNGFLATGLSGVAGVLLTFALGGGLFWLVRRRPKAATGAHPPAGEPAGTARPDSERGGA